MVSETTSNFEETPMMRDLIQQLRNVNIEIIFSKFVSIFYSPLPQINNDISNLITLGVGSASFT